MPAASGRPTYHEALRVAHQVHAAAMKDPRRKRHDEFAMIGGFVMLAALVSGFLLVNHFVWSADDAKGESNHDLTTTSFTVTMPSRATTDEFTLSLNGSVLQVSAWTSGSEGAGVTLMLLDDTLTVPGEPIDPGVAATRLAAMHGVVVARAVSLFGGHAGTPVATTVRGDPAWRSEISGGSSVAFITSVTHGNTVVAVQCGTSSAIEPVDCITAVNSLRIR